MAKLILAHDLGTSGNKATLFSSDGQLIRSSQYTYPTHYFHNNWAEQDADDWWKAVCACSKEVLTGFDPQDVAVVSFSGQMMACVCVDEKGTPLRKAIIWADQRAETEANHIRAQISEEDFYHITGHKISPSYSLEKLMWVKNHEPEIYQRTYRMLQAKDYIIYKLTGNFVTDYSDASGSHLFDLSTLQWSDQIIGISGIDREKLPELYPSTTVAGEVTAVAAKASGLAVGTPVVCGGGDGLCASVGAGCVKEGIAYNYIGSSSWIAIATPRPVYDLQMRTFTFAHIVPGMYSPTGTMQAAGASYQWLRNELAGLETLEAEKQAVSTYEVMNQLVQTSPVGAKGLLYLPYLLGERSPRWNPNARGAFIGLKMEHTRADLFRAVLEGITLNLNIILDVFKEHVGIDEMILIGGGAKGEVWRQMMADIYQLPVVKPNLLEEATAMGAAITGGVGIGLFDRFDVIDQFLEMESRQFPITENVKAYERVKPIFEQAYQQLVGVFDSLSEL